MSIKLEKDGFCADDKTHHSIFGGNCDMIKHKQYLAKEMYSAELANGIEWVLQNNQDGNLGANARKKVLANYTPEIVCGKYVELYESLLKTSQKKREYT